MKQRDDDLRGKLVCRQVAGQVGVSKKGSPGGLLLVMVMVVGERKSCPDRRARMAPFPAATSSGKQTQPSAGLLTHYVIITTGFPPGEASSWLLG